MNLSLYRIRKGMTIGVLATAISALCCFPLLSAERTVFEGGDGYTFYLKSTSSKAKTMVCPTEWAAAYRFFVRSELTGESTVYPTGDALSLIARYDGEVRFIEEAAGVTSYYCRSPRMKGSVSLYGEEINLHVAVREDGSVCIGTPIIFGGY